MKSAYFAVEAVPIDYPELVIFVGWALPTIATAMQRVTQEKVAWVELAKPETRNPKPETRNPKPETRNPKPVKY